MGGGVNVRAKRSELAVPLFPALLEVQSLSWGRGPRRLLEQLRGWSAVCFVILFSSGWVRD